MKPPSLDHDRRRVVRTAALRMLSDRVEPPTPSVVTATTLRALYRNHPHVGLEDVLELRVVLDSPITRGASVDDQVDDVLETVFTELTSWHSSPASI